MTPRAYAERAEHPLEELSATEGEPIADDALRLDDAGRQRVRAMFQEHYDIVFRILRRLGLERHRAEDGAQQVFMIAAQRLVDIAGGKERAFLTGSAVNVAQRIRGERQHQELASEPPRSGPNVEEMVDQKRSRERLDRLLREMNDDLRVVLVLAEIEGLGKREIAEALEIPEGTVASRLRRAREDFLLRLRRDEARWRAT